MPMSITRADQVLNDVLTTGTPHLWLHTDNPGNDGTLNVCQYSAANIVRKPITFSVPAQHATNSERIVLSTNEIAWNETEIDASQFVTYISVWSALSGGQVEFIYAIPGDTVSTGSEGITVEIGALEHGITVFST